MTEATQGRTNDGSAAPLSVILVNQYYVPDDAPTGRLLADVGAALAAEGHDVRAFASRRGYRDATIKYSRREVIDGVMVRRVGGTGFTQSKRWGRLINYFAFFASVGRQLLVTRKPDVIVALSTPPLLATVAETVAAMRGARFVYWVMDVHPELAFRLGHLKRTSITGRILEWSGRRTLGRSDAVIALGDDMARRIEPYSNGSTTVIPTWADGDIICPRSVTDHPLRSEWGWDGRFVVAYSGNMGLVHEFETIIDAATKLAGDDRYLFCFIGSGPREDEIRHEVSKRGLANVEFRPFVDGSDLSDSLTAPDVHLVSLREDLAGLSVPSKMQGILAAGKPLAFVGPAESDVASIVLSNACGIHVRNGDSESLVGGLHRYAECADTIAVHGKAARAAYDSSYDRSSRISEMIGTIKATA
ncbi:glycosyltransferase family 4 protein [Actinomycetota bacterium]